MNIDKLISSALAEKDTEKYIEIGAAFNYGDDVPYSRKDAIKWYKKAGNAGNSRGFLCLAYFYLYEGETKRSRKLAYRYFLKAAELGNIWAQVQVGDMYFYGDGVDASMPNAVQWYEKAASEREPEAYFALIRFYLDPSNPLYDKKKGKKWIRRILNLKRIDHISRIAGIFWYADAPMQSTKLAVRYFKHAAKLGCLESRLTLAEIYSKGEGIKKNSCIASKYLDDIFKSRDIGLIYRIANMLEFDEALKATGFKAVDWYRRGAQLGDEWSQYAVGRCYRYAKGCRESHKLAEHWLLKSAEQGNGCAAFSLGTLYKKDGPIQDYRKSMLFFRKALKEGIKNSYSSIGWLYMRGLGVRRSYANALRFFKNGIKSGDCRSYYGYGYMSYHGYGCTQDYKLAFKQYKKGYEKGHCYACFALAHMYENGLGCRKNLKRAVELYQRGAEHNIAGCIFNLGSFFDNGIYFDQDASRAVELFEEAAEMGDLHAKYYLGTRYLCGQDVKKNTQKGRRLLQESILQTNVTIFSSREYYHFARQHMDERNSLDAKEAIHWFEKAADMEEAEALYWLGILYEEGDLVPQNGKKSASYYRKAIKHGYFKACEKLARLYSDGKLIMKNHKRAVEMFRMAEDNGQLKTLRNDYAWLLATTHNPNLLDGALALQLIYQDIRKRGTKFFRVDTLAAAHAANGDFCRAIRAQKRAILQLKKENRLDEMPGFKDRLASYQMGKRWVK